MDIQKLFNQIINHMLEGMMVHEQLANYFNFLALEGYKCCHNYHYIEESSSYRRIQQYYIDHYNRILPEPQPSIIKVIPPNWYDITRQDISVNAKKEGIQKGILAWRNWEYETKKLYEQTYNQLINLGEIAGADKIRKLIIDVDNELAEVEQIQLEVLSINFDLTVIIPEQKALQKEYSKKIKNLDLIE